LGRSGNKFCLLQKTKTRNSEVGVKKLFLFLPPPLSVPPSPLTLMLVKVRDSEHAKLIAQKAKNTSMPCLKRCPHPARMKKPVHPKNPDCTEPHCHECEYARTQICTRISAVFALSLATHHTQLRNAHTTHARTQSNTDARSAEPPAHTHAHTSTHAHRFVARVHKWKRGDQALLNGELKEDE